MLEKKKSKEIDLMLKKLMSGGSVENTIMTEDEMTKWARISFCHDKRKKGYTKKQVVDMLLKDYGPMSLSTAYTVLSDTELLLGKVGVNPKDYMRVVMEEMILDGYRRAVAANNISEQGKFIDRLAKLYPQDENKGTTVPPDALQRHVVYLTMNPEDVGMERMSLEDITAFYTKMTKKATPRLLDITPKQHNDTDAQ